ncbi:MAG: hypothetical protein ACRYFX_30355 [Janthinobacterium lividum]
MPPFSLLALTPAQQALLADLESRGSVLDTVLLRPTQPPTDLDATCQAATLAAMEHLPARFRIERVPGTAPASRRISFAELLGPGYDLEQEARLFSPYSSIVHEAPSD